MTKARELALFTQSNPSGFAASARHEARQILSGSQYQSRPERSFRPLAGVLGAIGRFFDRVFGPLWRFLTPLIVSGPLSNVFGDWWPILVLAAVVVAGLLMGRIVIRRRALPGHQVARDEPADTKTTTRTSSRRWHAGRARRRSSVRGPTQVPCRSRPARAVGSGEPRPDADRPRAFREPAILHLRCSCRRPWSRSSTEAKRPPSSRLPRRCRAGAR